MLLSAGSLRNVRMAVVWATVTMLLVVGPGVLLTTVPASADTGFVWSGAFSVSAGTPVNDLSCPAANLCVGVNGGGGVLTSTNPTGGASAWSVSFVDDAAGPFDALTGVSCPTTSLCVATDDSGFVFTSTNPTGGASAWSAAHIDGAVYLDRVSCPAANLCVAVDDDGDILTSTNPTGGASTWSPAAVDSANAFDWVDCGSITLCVAVDDNGNIFVSTNPAGGVSAWSGTHVDGTNAFNAVSCLPQNFCDAVDDAGTAFFSSSPTTGNWFGDTIDAGNSLFDVGCGNPNFCIAVDNVGGEFDVVSPVGPHQPWNHSSIDGSTALYSVTCQSLFCLAGDANGNILVATINGFSQSIAITSTPPYDPLPGATYTMAASAGASGNPIVYSAEASSAGVCTVSGAVVTVTGAGLCRIDANQAGNANYSAAATKTQSFNTTELPVVSPSIKLTRSVAVIGIQCFSLTPCSGSVHLTRTVTHLVKKGKRRVRVSTTQTLGARAVSLVNPGTLQIPITLNTVGKADAVLANKHALAADLVYYRSGMKTVVPVVLRR